MDRSREQDVIDLRNKMYDQSAPYFFRRMAGQSLLNVQYQIKDRNIVKLRAMLIKALSAGDSREADKIGDQVKNYIHLKGEKHYG